jgi:hypothetical protein
VKFSGWNDYSPGVSGGAYGEFRHCRCLGSNGATLGGATLRASVYYDEGGSSYGKPALFKLDEGTYVCLSDDTDECTGTQISDGSNPGDYHDYKIAGGTTGKFQMGFQSCQVAPSTHDILPTVILSGACQEYRAINADGTLNENPVTCEATLRNWPYDGDRVPLNFQVKLTDTSQVKLTDTSLDSVNDKGHSSHFSFDSFNPVGEAANYFTTRMCHQVCDVSSTCKYYSTNSRGLLSDSNNESTGRIAYTVADGNGQTTKVVIHIAPDGQMDAFVADGEVAQTDGQLSVAEGGDATLVWGDIWGISESSENGMALQAQLTAPVARDTYLSFNQETSGIAAIEGSDYRLSSTQIMIPAGSLGGSVTLTPINDGMREGNEGVSFTATEISGGCLANPASLSNANSLSVQIVDDDSAGLSVTPANGGIAVSETGTTDTFTVALTSQPSANVTVAVTSGDTGEATVSPASLTFTPATWSTPQTVTVTGVEDYAVDGDWIGQVTLAVTSVDDLYYNNIANVSQPITVSDSGNFISISVSYNGTIIADGDKTPSMDDGTDFGMVAINPNPVWIIGDSIPTRAFIVTNNGTVNIDYIDALVYGTGYNYVGLIMVPQGPLEPGESRGRIHFSDGLGFAPPAPGIYSGTVSYLYRGPDNVDRTYSFAVSGTGTSTAPIASPAPLSPSAVTASFKDTNNPLTLSVTYSDTDGNLDPASVGTNDLVITGSATLPVVSAATKDAACNSSECTVNYTIIPANGGNWISGYAGTFTVALAANAVVDTVGLAAPAATLASVSVDFSPPTVQSISADDVTTAGGERYTVGIHYADSGLGLDQSSIDTADVVITPPGEGAPMTPDHVVKIEDVARYSFTPPGGTWDAEDDGTYTIAIVADQVKDVAGNAVAPTTKTFTVAATPKLFHVNPLAADSLETGEDWANAFLTLQNALAAARAGDTIWVAAGVYTPGAADDRAASFAIPAGVAVYGGFAGTETALEERDWRANRTILSGDLAGDDADADGNAIAETAADIAGVNADHVVTLIGTPEVPIAADTILDGFIITAGQADGEQPQNGGGLWCGASGTGAACSPTLANLSFFGNRAYSGGAIYNVATDGAVSEPTLSASHLQGNQASLAGGAWVSEAKTQGTSAPSLTNVLLMANQAEIGGAFVSTLDATATGQPRFDRVTMIGNVASVSGGALYNWGTSPILTNCLLSGNRAETAGGAIYNNGLDGYTANPVLTNVTLVGNSATYGGAMNSYALNGSAAPTLTNVIVWGNSTNEGQIRDTEGSATALSYTLLEGGQSAIYSKSGANSAFNDGTGNLADDPLFADVSTGDLRLRPGSPAIDAGLADGTPATDLRGLPRDAAPDLGAYELQVTLSTSAGDGQSAFIGSPFVTPLTVSANGTDSDLLTGTQVTFSAPTSGASATFDTNPAIMICTGDPAICTAETQATANAVADDNNPYPVTASLGTATATFQLKNRAWVYSSWMDVRGGIDSVRIPENDTTPSIAEGTDFGALDVDSGALTQTFTIKSNTTTVPIVFADPEVWVDGAAASDFSVTAQPAIAFLSPGDSTTFTLTFDPSVAGTRLATIHVAMPGTAATYSFAVAGQGNSSAVNSTPTATDVAITQTSEAGMILSGSYVYADAESDPEDPSVNGTQFRWIRSTDPSLATSADNETLASGATGGMAQSYVVQATDRGKTLFYCVTPVATAAPTTGTEVCSPGSTIDVMETAPTAEVTIDVSTDDTGVGAELIGHYVYHDADNDAEDTGVNGTQYRWAIVPGGDIAMGLTEGGNIAHVVAGWERGSSLVFCVTPAALTGTHFGTEVCSVPQEVASMPITWYVDPRAQGLGDGLTWTDAFTTLQDGLAAQSLPGDQFWVAEGIYYPDEGGMSNPGDPMSAFEIPNGVALFGGFAGTETALDQRDWYAHPTILSGDIDQDDITDAAGITVHCDDIRGINSDSVVTTADMDSPSQLDGFIITGGGNDASRGGGWGDYGGTPTLRHLVFCGNRGGQGGGMYSRSATLTLDQVRFIGNCADYGGALYNDGASPTIVNSAFSGNRAETAGGAIYNDAQEGSMSSPTLVNVSLANNSAQYGAALSSNGASAPTLTNVLVWGNHDALAQIRDDYAVTTLNYSLLEDGASGYWSTDDTYNAFSNGMGNLSADPLLLDPAHGDLRPASTDSPLIDTGNTSAANALELETDLAGNPRIQGAGADIGAYESAPPLALPSGTRNVTGTDGDDRIEIVRGVTAVTGGGGDDIIDNAIGRQTLDGGSGADVFVYRNLSERGDIIENFEPAHDRLDVSTLLAKLGYDGADPLGDGYLSLRASGSADTTLYVDPDGATGRAPAVPLVLLRGITPEQISATNIIPAP